MWGKQHLFFPPVYPALISTLRNHRSFVYQVPTRSSTLPRLTSLNSWPCLNQLPRKLHARKNVCASVRQCTPLLRKNDVSTASPSFGVPKPKLQTAQAPLPDLQRRAKLQSSRGSYHVAPHPTHARAGQRHERFSPRPPRGRSPWRRCSQSAARRGSEAGDAREVTCAASLRGPQPRAEGRPAQGPVWPRRAKIARQTASHTAQPKSFKLSKNSNLANTKATPSTPAQELPCGAWPASPGVLHIPLWAGYSVRFAHRVSAPAEEPARAPDVHVTAHALLPARSPPRKRKQRRELHLPRPSPNTRRPNGPGAAARPLGPAPGAEAAAFPDPSNPEKPAEASRTKEDKEERGTPASCASHTKPS